MRLRLYLDEDVIPELARILRSQGDDVFSAHEVGALRLSDEEQLTRATSEDRAILTFNYRDFLTLGERWFLAGQAHAGIVISYQQYHRRELGALRRATIALLESASAEDLRDSVYVLDQYRSEN